MGELIAFISTLGFATANVLARKAAMHSSESTSLAGSLLSSIITMAIALIIYAVTLLFGQHVTLNMEGILWFAASGFLSVYVGRTFLYYSLEHLDSVSAANIKNLSPFFTVIIAAIFLGESITFSMVIGGILIFTGLFMVSNKRQKASMLGVTLKKPLFIAGNIGLMYGILSAFGYATGNSIRKQGMMVLPDPYMGAIVGSAVGILVFVVFAMFNPNYRDAFVSIRRSFQPSLFFSGVAISAGQILFLVSLMYTGVARSTLIVSAQTILTVLISKWVFKTKEDVSKKLVFSVLCTMVGVAFIIII